MVGGEKFYNNSSGTALIFFQLVCPAPRGNGSCPLLGARRTTFRGGCGEDTGAGSGSLSGRRRRLPVGPVEVEGIPVRQAPQLRRTWGRRLRDAEERAVGGLKGPAKARSRGSRGRAVRLGEGRLQERLRDGSGKRGATDGVAGL